MENLPDDILATIGSYIAINPTLNDRKLKLWGKWADIFFNNRTKQEWLEKISKTHTLTDIEVLRFVTKS